MCGGRGDDDHVALAANDVDLVRRGWIDGVKEPSWLCRKARWIQVRIPPMRFLLSFQVVIQLFAPPVPECYDYLKVKRTSHSSHRPCRVSSVSRSRGLQEYIYLKKKANVGGRHTDVQQNNQSKT